MLLQNFIAIAIFIGDGLYNFLKIGILSLQVSMAIPCRAHLALASYEDNVGCWTGYLWPSGYSALSEA